jgi:sortase (surface protein transpeptidase)
MRRFKPKLSGEIRVKPGRRTFWLARPSRLSVGLSLLSVVLVVLGMIAAGVPVVPMVWYSLKPSVTSDLARILNAPVAPQAEASAKRADEWQPEKDETLPEGGWLSIPSIGVKTEVIEEATENYEAALRRGVWRVPEFGTPLKRELPMIVAAHRFGYLKWTNQYRRTHSFFNLPKLKVAEKVYISWGQREYVYEIYAGDEGTEITDYSADLILYTCQYLESDVRIFRYARLVKN